MASPSIYERQINYKYQQQFLQMPETLNSPRNISEMSSKKKPKLSRLELMRQNYEKKRQKDVEERLAGLRAEQSARSGSSKNHNGGTVRAFFAERRAMEASVKGDAYSLPPIESHFRKMKESSHQSSSPHQTKTVDYSHHRMGSGKMKPVVYHRKKSKGVDKQNPLPPLQKGHSNTHKPPTPNRRYETHHTLASEENVQQQQQQHHERSAFHHVPQPPHKPKPVGHQARPIVESRNDYTDDNYSNYSDEPAPNLSKVKALRQKKLSKQRSLVKQESIEKMTDFQKWQLEQDRERTERLQKHKEKNRNQESDQSVSLSMRERELLEKIKAEQEKLKEIKRLQQELEEQEKSEDEDINDFMDVNKTENMHYNLADPPDGERNTEPAKEHVQLHQQKAEVTRKQQVMNQDETEMNTQTQPKENYTALYEQVAENEKQIDVNLSPCSICGRKFAIERLERHEKICDKNSKTKRKAFDVQKQRVAGMEHEKYVVSGNYKKEPPKAKKADWRVQHENFIKTIRYAKGDSNEPPPVIENPHYVACPYCERKFNPETAERHIPRCKDIKSRPAPPKSNRKR